MQPGERCPNRLAGRRYQVLLNAVMEQKVDAFCLAQAKIFGVKVISTDP